MSEACLSVTVSLETTRSNIPSCPPCSTLNHRDAVFPYQVCIPLPLCLVYTDERWNKTKTQEQRNETMHEENAKHDQGRTGAEKRNGFDMAACCGTVAADMMRECPCGTAFKRHPLAAMAILGVMLLVLIISQIGGILGILAFLRTA